MNYGLIKAKELGYDTAFLVDNPEYYQKFGFLCVTNYNLKNMTTIPEKYVMKITKRRILKQILDIVEDATRKIKETKGIISTFQTEDGIIKLRGIRG